MIKKNTVTNNATGINNDNHNENKNNQHKHTQSNA